jgi:hypothetical protein
MSEDLLKGLLHDILGVLSRARNASRNEENPLLVSPDQDFKGVAIAAFGGNDERRVFRGRTNEGNVPQSCFVNLVYDFGWHCSAPSPSLFAPLAFEQLLAFPRVRFGRGPGTNAHRDIRTGRPASRRTVRVTPPNIHSLRWEWP